MCISPESTRVRSRVLVTDSVLRVDDDDNMYVARVRRRARYLNILDENIYIYIYAYPDEAHMHGTHIAFEARNYELE